MAVNTHGDSANSAVDTNAHEAVTTHESTADQGIAASLGLNTSQFIWQLFNFAVVAAVIWFLILKPLVKKMEERQKMVEESVDNAKKIESNLQMSEQKFQEKVDEAKVEANKVIARAQDEADGLASKMRQKAQGDVDELIKQAKEKIEEQKNKMTQELREETGSLVVAALEKILNEKIDDKTDKKLIEDALKKLS